MAQEISQDITNPSQGIIRAINEASIPNNQLGMDDMYEDSIGDSTEEEIINMIERRRKSKAMTRAPKRGRQVVQDDPEEDESSSEEAVDDEPGEIPTPTIKKKMWHIILHNRTTEQVMEIIKQHEERFTRCIACKDEGEEEHTTHFHIGIVLKTSTTIGGIKAMFGLDSHVKYAKNLANLFNYIRGDGNHADFKEVIFKKNDYVTKRIGTGLRQRFYEEWWKKPTMDHFYEMIKEREWMTCCDQRKHVEAMVDNLNRWNHLRPNERVIVWISGATGTGKSYLTHHMMDQWQRRTNTAAISATISSTAGQLVGIKREEKMVVFDDIKVEKIVVQDLLQVIDQYPIHIDVKGSSSNYNPDLVVITCLNTVEDLGNLRDNWTQKEVQQLARRVTHRIHVTKENNQIKYHIEDKNEIQDLYVMQQVIDLILNAVNPMTPPNPQPE